MIKPFAVAPGDYATPLSFRFGAGGAEMISITSKGGMASQLFAQLDKEIPPGPPDLPKLLEIAQKHRVTVAA